MAQEDENRKRQKAGYAGAFQTRRKAGTAKREAERSFHEASLPWTRFCFWPS